MSKTEDNSAKRQQRKTVVMWSVGLVIVFVVFLLLAKVVSKPSSSDSGGSNGIASSELMAKITGVPASVFATVGQGSSNPLPKVISAPALTQDGKPRIIYIGAEYCPFCAAQRWPMVVALSRFGTFTNLGTTHSASADVFPNTQTFTFHGSSYSSPYVVITPVEQQSNQLQGTSYAQLDTPTADEQAIIKTYDAPPYVSADSAGSIPFIYYGGKFLTSGASYSPSVLQGKTADEIASALSDPNSDIARGIIGTANAMSAAICNMTNQQPANVCSTQAIKDIQAKLK